MKFKNSYILLMVMAIFLLVSIGSVCASDNVTDDADVELASADDSVVLSEDSTDEGNTLGNTSKVDTTIESDSYEKTFRENESVVIPVTVKDNSSNELNISAGNLSVSDVDGKAVKFTYNNTTGITLVDKLARGDNWLTIGYLGNSAYNNSTKDILIKIYGDYELNLIDAGTQPDGNYSAVMGIKLTDGINVNNTLLTESNTNITLKDKNGTILNISKYMPSNFWDKIWTENTLHLGNLSALAFPVTLTVNYTSGNKSLVKTVELKKFTQLNITPDEVHIEVNENEEINLTVLVETDYDGNYLTNLTASNFTVTGATVTSYNDTTHIMTLKGLARGIHEVTIAYKGDGLYNASSKYIAFIVRGSVDIVPNSTTVKVNSTKKGTITVNITNGIESFSFSDENINLTITYKDGNATKTINATVLSVKNGTITFTYEGDNFTSGNLTIFFNNGTYNTTKNVTLNRIYNVKITPVTTTNEYLSGNFTFKVVDIDNETLSLKGKQISLTLVRASISTGFTGTIDENNMVIFKNSNLYVFDQSLSSSHLVVGTHTVKLSTSGVMNSTAQTINLTVTKANIKIVMTKYNEYYGSSKNLTFTVTNSKTGEPISGIILKLYFPKISSNYFYISTNSSGVAHIGVKGIVGGTYDLQASNNDTTNIAKTTLKDTMTIKKIPVTLTGKNVKIYFNTGNTYTIKVTKSGKAVSGVYVFVRLYTTSSKYSDYLFQTNSKGKITFSASLAVGSHKIIVSLADNRYSASQITRTIKVIKSPAKIKAPKVTAYYKGGKYLTVKVINTKKNKVIYNAKVNIKVFVSSTRYYNYNGYTGSNGQIKLALDNLKPGKYKVVVKGADSKNFKASKINSKIVIKKAPTKLSPKKLTAKKGKSSYFKVTVKNKKTKKIIKGVKIKVKVYTGKKYKTYTLKTNSKGIAKLNVKKLKVGTHKVIVTSANKYCVAKKAKSTIKITK